ncbi:MAG: tRNA (adenosine(37)-N6)-dimethylallyltransferase MiaA [Candidatus Omnitrophica bacterium]|nr:tRNA (adenosine(37)-N6)-dimethylallyltransferase MiaA [Candidatus Omnitrophota bacterium]
MPSIIALMGPTAVGKTDVSIELAKRLGAEIVGCDSMQVYRRMAVLSQQPTPEQRAAVPHHLIDCVEPTESFSVGRYRRDALEAIEAIHRRGKTVLLVGGTGLYLKALADGLCEAPPVSPRIRETLWQLVEERGHGSLYERLQAVDPVAAGAIHPHNARRVVRALEVYEATGEPLSSFWERARGAGRSITVIALDRDRAELYARINRRVERMLSEERVLDEVKVLLTLPLSHTARQVHGLKFLESFLRGEQGLEETIRAWQQQVRNYAKRQLTWFRADPRVRWITLAPHETSKDATPRILPYLGSDPQYKIFAISVLRV